MGISVGINVSLHDTSLAVVHEGKLALAIEVERISRMKKNRVIREFAPYAARSCIKNLTSRVDAFATLLSLHLADKFMKNKFGVSLKDADAVAVNFEPSLFREKEHLKYFDTFKMHDVFCDANYYSPLSPRRRAVPKLVNDVLRLELSKEAKEMVENIEKIEITYKRINSKASVKILKKLLGNKGRLWVANVVGKKYGGWLGEGLRFAFRWEPCTKKEISVEESIMLRRGVVEDFIRFAWKLLFNSKPPKVVTVPHHLAHAASAYYTSGMKKAVAIVVDGAGEYEATSVWSVKDGQFEKLASLDHNRYSLGEFYEAVSVCLGLGRLDGPGKVMGLAPYGKPNEKYLNVIRSILKVHSPKSEVPYEVSGGFYEVLEKLKEANVCPKWDPKARPLDRDAADLAYALQSEFERAYLTTMEWGKELSGMKEAVIAGGVALNAKANMEVVYSDIFNDVFFFPAANDAGTAIGAAIWAYEHVLGERFKNERIKDVYWGLEYSEEDFEEAKKLAKRMGLKIEEDYPIENLVDDYLLKNEIAVVYQGRAEFGPRALGHRSIVADARIKENWERVNFHKGREWWRPLAPSLLYEKAPEYFERGIFAPFMIVMERFKEEGCKRAPATCHVDRTARPQTVTQEIDENWYKLIKAFGDATGEYIVINTSFNLGGEPLVDSPVQALLSFTFGGFDALWLHGTLIHK